MKILEEFGRLSIILGVFLVLIGLFFYFFSKVEIQRSFLKLPRMPFDILIEKENFKFYFPLGTSIIISIILTIILNVFFKFLKK
ncbi:MAG: DUF2905 domain-containing protein [Candidatus Hydrothermales bacterium]